MMKLTGVNVLTVLVLAAFMVISFLAMKPEAAGVNKDVVMYLLGAWQSLATAVVAYHVGSSAGSKAKDDQIKAATDTAVDAAKVATATATATTATAATVAANVVQAAADAAKS